MCMCIKHDYAAKVPAMLPFFCLQYVSLAWLLVLAPRWRRLLTPSGPAMGKRAKKRRSQSVLKTNAYFSRFQVKFARRRAGT